MFFFLIYVCMDVRKRTSILVTGALLRVGVLQVLCCVSKSACSFCLTGPCACTHTVLTFIFFFLSDGVSFPFFCSYIYIHVYVYILFVFFFRDFIGVHLACSSTSLMTERIRCVRRDLLRYAYFSATKPQNNNKNSNIAAADVDWRQQGCCFLTMR